MKFFGEIQTGDDFVDKDYVDAAANNVVTLDGNQSITGRKTFVTPASGAAFSVVPQAAQSSQVLRLDAHGTSQQDFVGRVMSDGVLLLLSEVSAVTLWGSNDPDYNCLLDGVKTPILPYHAANKGYVDAADAALQTQIDGLGEPFRVKQWASNTLNVEIPTCTEDIGNTAIPKMVFAIDDVEGADYQIVGMIAYEVSDAASGGNRINCWPVCQFTGNGQKELSVRWMCGGTTRKTAKRINAWVLLKHR